MDYYSKLKELVSNDRLEILYIMSPPRTLSTILEIALAEYGDGQIHEPFHRRNRKSFNNGCRIIYERVCELQSLSGKNSIKLVIKDISKYVTPDEWRLLTEIANRFIFTIREPSRQMFSLASRYANDVNDLEDSLNYKQIIANLPKIPFDDLAANYWENTLQLLKITEEHVRTVRSSRIHKYLLVISSASFRYDIDGSVKKLLARLELKVSPQTILKDWRVGSGKNFFRPSAVMGNIIEDKNISKGPWLGRAINSRSFSSINIKQDSPQDIDIYDKSLQRYFLQTILPTFVEIYLSESNACKPDPSSVLSQDFIKSALAKINPIESYLLTKSLLPQNPNQRIIARQNCLKLERNIKNRYPYIAEVFLNLAG